MDFIEKGQKKTYISTFRFNLKSSAALDVSRRTENGTKPTNREKSSLKSEKSGQIFLLSHITLYKFPQMSHF